MRTHVGLPATAWKGKRACHAAAAGQHGAAASHRDRHHQHPKSLTIVLPPLSLFRTLAFSHSGLVSFAPLCAFPLAILRCRSSLSLSTICSLFFFALLFFFSLFFASLLFA